MRLTIKTIKNIIGWKPEFYGHCAIYFENYVYFFKVEKVFVYDTVKIKPKELGKINSIDQSIHMTTIKTESDEDQFLVLSEVFYPVRWKAFIDNDPVKTFQVNGLLRGIIVPKGSHKIKFIYDKSSFNFGLSVSLLLSLIHI